MRALVTNDDGVRSPGLIALARAAVRVGIDVVVAAPSWDSSGSSASLTAVEESPGSPLRQRHILGGLDVTCFAVEATPAYIVRAGLDREFGAAPDVVLSGINRGLNTGRNVLHSGTVGAALSAANRGCKAAAFSIDSDGNSAYWSTAAEVAEEVIEWVCNVEGPIALNVNVPNVTGTEVGGLRHARLAPSGSVQTAVTEVGSSHHQITTDIVDGHSEIDSDTSLVAAGVACFTVLQPVCEDPTIVTTDLEVSGIRGRKPGLP